MLFTVSNLTKVEVCCLPKYHELNWKQEESEGSDGVAATHRDEARLSVALHFKQASQGKQIIFVEAQTK